MILRGDVQKVHEALLEREWSYWLDHKQEWLELCRDPGVLWDGYHWNFVRKLVQAKLWWDLKHHINVTICETYLKDQMLYLFQSVSPRFYQELWGENV